MYPCLQIASVIRATVLRGKYVLGQQMPPIRTLAKREECNPATVQKALKVLEKQGLIVSRGSKGFFVIESEKKIIELRNQNFNRLTKILFEKLYDLGFSDSEIIKLFDRIETEKMNKNQLCVKKIKILTIYIINKMEDFVCLSVEVLLFLLVFN